MFAKLLGISAGDDNNDQFMTVSATGGLIGKVWGGDRLMEIRKDRQFGHDMMDFCNRSG